MSANRLRIDRVALGEVLEQMSRLTKSVEEDLAAIDELVKDLHLTWTGQAASAQRQAHAEWASGAAEMRQSLADLHSVGTTAHSNYNAAVEANLKMWRR
ncbi:WXG100 family type VII secretion target [Nocardia sp. 348MFTsu5.1]|uniref:WXG100 family type VII secretion target n=1 Tax=Nocardia sp. 348MFTsu5.1 TaxID=1172185 RepID=UPI00035DBECC|nr:WXG100 family type VII secretion target [Nocardia sp. 348MFTsu5.1]